MDDKPDNLVYLDVVTRLDIPAERVLDRATKANLKNVVVIGYDQEGEEYFASSMADGADVVWLMERFKQMLLSL